jgi:hypothetical protein
MTEAEVIPLRGGPMNEADYDRAKALIVETYGKSGGEASARWQQEFGKLFHRSGWTQERLAKKEKKSQKWVDFNLRFGRFLSSGLSTDCTKLKEGPFREHWLMTDKELSERERFREVERLLTDAASNGARRSNEIGKAIRAHFMDGKWHSPETIAKHIDQPEAEIIKTLDLACGRGKGNATYRVEKIKRPRGAFEYRIFATEKKVSTFELIEKLTPIIEYLRTEGKKMMATSTIVAARESATRLENLLKEWTE